ncbi:MAG: hypothetical protein PHN56_03245 [Candidatus Nanoarchaeia archaeon]|nr:hypothetical protein [Candidatus Nanoarchaeia archaeon]
MSEVISEKEKQLVIFRLSKMPANKKISIGSEGQFNKDELIQHVENEDAVGKKIVEIQMAFLRAMKSGTLYA